MAYTRLMLLKHCSDMEAPGSWHFQSSRKNSRFTGKTTKHLENNLLSFFSCFSFFQQLSSPGAMSCGMCRGGWVRLDLVPGPWSWISSTGCVSNLHFRSRGECWALGVFGIVGLRGKTHLAVTTW